MRGRSTLSSGPRGHTGLVDRAHPVLPDELRPLFVSTGSVVPFPRSSDMPPSNFMPSASLSSSSLVPSASMLLLPVPAKAVEEEEEDDESGDSQAVFFVRMRRGFLGAKVEAEEPAPRLAVAICHKDEVTVHKKQLKREQSCHHGAEFRLECLRQVCSLAIVPSSSATVIAAATVSEEMAPPFNSGHINLFDGVLDFAFFAAQDESKRPLRETPDSRRPSVRLNSFLSDKLQPAAENFGQGENHHHHHHHQQQHLPPPLPAGGATASWAFLWEPQDVGSGVAELREAVVRATAELESTRAAAQEELRVAQGRALHLAALLDSTARERDQLRRHCHSLLLLLSHHLHHHHHQNPSPPPTIPPNPPPPPNPFLDDVSNASNEEEEGSNNGTSPPPPPPPPAAAALEAEVEAAAARRGLPEKGRLVEAVVAAGPLLQTLLLAGPLPRWRHPPPPLLAFEIPPVAASLNPSPDTNNAINNTNNTININISDPDATPAPPLLVMASASSSPESNGCELQHWYHHTTSNNNNNNNNTNNNNNMNSNSTNHKLNSFFL
ncbi:uncharacterized protein LOC109707464 [Ananas comosus]|uniref:Uncharacterized protein LOC109707464 n=1 Tax=Ananas comosus TaxID=4615 RepID=A0A6P5ESZ3_ANACO|nr:uncharacterized protein LOC109707464 [Ananas comosus]